MDDLRFTWDPANARENQRKHGIAFEEAQTVFADDHAILLPDVVHSGEEERFYLLGMSARLRVLVVIHCYREEASAIRLISARPATPTERTEYGARWIR